MPSQGPPRLTPRVPAGVLESATYPEFKKALQESHCPRCPALCAQRHTIVVDRGTPSSPILVIGEAPGENEDLTGKAFVGRGGKLFDRLMLSIGIDTNRDVLIANVVKCRPPNNRPPTQEEADNCRPYLLWQIRHVRPKIIVLLGATAVRHLDPASAKLPMKGRVGGFFELSEHPGVLFQLLYHPAYLLRDPRKQPEALEHLKALQAKLAEIGQITSARSDV